MNIYIIYSVCYVLYNLLCMLCTVELRGASKLISLKSSCILAKFGPRIMSTVGHVTHRQKMLHTPIMRKRYLFSICMQSYSSNIYLYHYTSWCVVGNTEWCVVDHTTWCVVGHATWCVGGNATLCVLGYATWCGWVIPHGVWWVIPHGVWWVISRGVWLAMPHCVWWVVSNTTWYYVCLILYCLSFLLLFFQDKKFHR